MLAACLEGDQQAWDLLVERYTRLVYSIALKSGLGEQDAADVVQNVFMLCCGVSNRCSNRIVFRPG